MNWSYFAQIIIAFALGSHTYSCGRAGASLMEPINNVLARTLAIVSRRNEAKANHDPIQPTIRS